MIRDSRYDDDSYLETEIHLKSIDSDILNRVLQFNDKSKLWRQKTCPVVLSCK